jgi:hypothetical protein
MYILQYPYYTFYGFIREEHRVKEERNIVHTIRRMKANYIGHILRRNCFLGHVIEGKIEGKMAKKI